MNSGFLNVPWWIWGGLSLGIAVVFVFFVPAADKVNAATGLQFVIARWFHSLCWLLIALNFFVRAWGGENLGGLANLLGAGGGVVYAIFILTFLQISSR